jgi:hypothetical protein
VSDVNVCSAAKLVDRPLIDPRGDRVMRHDPEQARALHRLVLAEPQHDRPIPLPGDLRRLHRDNAGENADDDGDRAAQDERPEQPGRQKGHEDEKRDDVHSSSFVVYFIDRWARTPR